VTLAIAIASVIALSALLLGILALFQVRALLRASGRRIEAFRTQHEQALDQMRESLQSLTAEVRELQAQPLPDPAGSFKNGLNLSKRSQALRMHRRGDTAEQIAAALDIPPQEVELLIKVQRIVLSNL
jgi:DNA-binding NarL/FixJ family response regulator